MSAQEGKGEDAGQLPDPSSEGTSGIWVRALRGDQNANTPLQNLERRYLMRLRVYVSHKLGPAMRQRHDPDEIINDAWWRAVRNIDRFEYRQKGSFLGWLRKQVHWVILDRCRDDKDRTGHARLGPRSSDSKSSAALDPSHQGPGPLTEVGCRDGRDQLVASLESVPEIYRRILERACLQEMSRAEIAEELGLKLNTVSQQLKRGLEHWKRVLGENPLKYI